MCSFCTYGLIRRTAEAAIIVQVRPVSRYPASWPKNLSAMLGARGQVAEYVLGETFGSAMHEVNCESEVEHGFSRVRITTPSYGSTVPSRASVQSCSLAMSS